MCNFSSFFHIKGLRYRFSLFLINSVYCGTSERYFERKRRLLIGLGHKIGEGTKIVGPIECTGNLIIGKNCWIGKKLTVNGNGTVYIGDNCDIGPEVTFQTGGHRIGTGKRRAGIGETYSQYVGAGTWIGGRSTILNNTRIGTACVVAGCACVTRDIPDNALVGGVPAKIIRYLENASNVFE